MTVCNLITTDMQALHGLCNELIQMTNTSKLHFTKLHNSKKCHTMIKLQSHNGSWNFLMRLSKKAERFREATNVSLLNPFVRISEMPHYKCFRSSFKFSQVAHWYDDSMEMMLTKLFNLNELGEFKFVKHTDFNVL